MIDLISREARTEVAVPVITARELIAMLEREQVRADAAEARLAEVHAILSDLSAMERYDEGVGYDHRDDPYSTFGPVDDGEYVLFSAVKALISAALEGGEV